MKLYATTTSERGKPATKSGNEYICIKLTVQNGSKLDYPIGEIILEYKDDVETHQVNQNEWILKYLPHCDYDAQIIDQGNVEPPKKSKCITCGELGGKHNDDACEPSQMDIKASDICSKCDIPFGDCDC